MEAQVSYRIIWYNVYEERRNTLETGIKIGADKEAVKAVADAIQAILASGQDQATIQIALQTLERGVNVTGTVISDNTIGDMLPPKVP